MKKRLVFSMIIALVLIVAGITAVGAYEGYKVNVKVHVETAIAVDTEVLDMGIVFPQQSKEKTICFGLTESFIEQWEGGYSTVNYRIFVMPKPVPADMEVCNPIVMDNEDYFQSIHPFIKYQMDGVDFTPLDVVDECGLYIYAGNLNAPGDTCDYLHLIFDAPNFPGYYVECTDPSWPWPVFPALVDGQGIWCLEEETICDDGNPDTSTGCEFTAMVPHADLGMDLVIQVWGFGADVP